MEERATKGKSNRFWLLVIGLLLAAAVVGLLAVRAHRQTGSLVQVTQDGQVTDTFPLSRNLTRRYESPSGGYNIVVVEDGAVRVTEASCPDKICVRHGPTDQTADPIVCLPNRLVVEILAPDGTDQLDGVSS